MRPVPLQSQHASRPATLPTVLSPAPFQVPPIPHNSRSAYPASSASPVAVASFPFAALAAHSAQRTPLSSILPTTPLTPPITPTALANGAPFPSVRTHAVTSKRQRTSGTAPAPDSTTLPTSSNAEAPEPVSHSAPARSPKLVPGKHVTGAGGVDERPGGDDERAATTTYQDSADAGADGAVMAAAAAAEAEAAGVMPTRRTRRQPRSPKQEQQPQSDHEQSSLQDDQHPQAALLPAATTTVTTTVTTTTSATITTATTTGQASAAATGAVAQSDPSTLTVAQVSAALRSLGLPVSGRKADLVLRLKAATAASVGGGGDGGGGAGGGAAIATPSRGTDAGPVDMTAAGAAGRKQRRSRSVTAVVAALIPPHHPIGDDDGDGSGGAEVVRRASRTQRKPPLDAAPEHSGAPTRGVKQEEREEEEEEETGRLRKGGSIGRLRGAPGSATSPTTGVPAGLTEARAGKRTVAAAPERRSTAAAGAGLDRDSDGNRDSSGRGPMVAASRVERGMERGGWGPESRTERQRSVRRESASGAGDLEELGPPPDLTKLPPWPVWYLGQPRLVTDLAPGDVPAQEELLLSNAPGLALTCLGSAGAGGATAHRAHASLALARGKDIFLFDVGDDTQRQLARAFHVKPSKLFRIFLTSLAPEAVLGLPGMMCTINAARERGHELCDIPVHVYGPPGTAAFLATMLRMSQTCLEVTTIVHEFLTRPVPTAELAPRMFARRSRIWRRLLPPDQLNPEGCVDASLLQFAPEQGRGQKKKGRNAGGGVLAFDPRAGYLPWPPLEPGDPNRTDLDPLSLSWTLQLDLAGRVVVNTLPGGRPTLAYTVMEADRAGALVVERAQAAGLRGGPEFMRLKEGNTIMNMWGQPVVPELVISPTRPGRRVVVMGDTTDPAALLTHGSHGHLRGADVLVPGTVWQQGEEAEAAAAGGCSTSALGETVRQLGVRYVLLSRFDSRRVDVGGEEAAESDVGDNDDGYVAALAHEVAAQAYGSDAAIVVADNAKGALSGGMHPRVIVLEDLQSVLVDKNEGPEERIAE